MMVGPNCAGIISLEGHARHHAGHIYKQGMSA